MQTRISYMNSLSNKHFDRRKGNFRYFGLGGVVPQYFSPLHCASDYGTLTSLGMQQDNDLTTLLKFKYLNELTNQKS